MAWTNEQMAARVASDIERGWVVNLGVGLPTRVAGHLTNRPVTVHAENGILGVGPPPAPGHEDPDVVDPGKNPVTVLPGAAFMDSLTSFALIRGGHLDLAVVGAFQVSERGDLANWRLPDRRVGAIGGAADLAAGARRVWVMMSHTTKAGDPKVVASCTYPLTAPAVVSRIYTELAVIAVEADGLHVVELAPGVALDDVRRSTGAALLAAGRATSGVTRT